jgi:glutamate N-acetyltransferase/amino-acid N-acetyltransferase
MKHALPKGFTASGIAAGIKKIGKKDLGLIFSQTPASTAALFTRNRVQAAPVCLDRQRVASGEAQAVIANSGNANCCTGNQGDADARLMTRLAAEELGVAEDLVLVASTGVIGVPMPMQRITAAVPTLVRAMSPEGLDDFAEAIMTTDTVPKVIVDAAAAGGVAYTICAVAKGAGMIRPDMATMLCFVCTDVAAEPALLRSALAAATERSFNRISIDGDTSTNDTIILMANGHSGAGLTAKADRETFQTLLDRVLVAMARELVRDGEGATKLVEIRVRGAASDREARAVADTIAHSNLVKTALFGEDANWGRILAAAGRAGVDIDPDRIDLFFDDVCIFSGGRCAGKDVEAQATRVLKRPEFDIVVDLKMGNGRAAVITCDFSVDYVRINADYRS